MRRIADLPYRVTGSTGQADRCTADLYLPDATEADALIFLHGGGLTEGDKGGPGPPILVPAGVALISPNYRLLHHAAFPACIDDTAAVTAWAAGAMAAHGVTCRRLFIGGISAGAYLAAMVALDGSWLAPYGTDPSCIAGVLPISGQMTSHFAYRSSIGRHPDLPLLDRFAPLYHVSKTAPPMLLVVGSDDLPCRPEENHYMAAAMRAVAHGATSCHVINGRNHSTIGSGLSRADDPVTSLMHRFLAAPGG